MALSIYSLEDRKKLLFVLDDELTNLLQDTFHKLEIRTGLVIDLYGDTRLYNNHLSTLLSLISELKFAKANKKYESAILNLENFIHQALHEDIAIILIGN